MILMVIESVLGFLVENLVIGVVCYVLTPAVWLISLPFILVIALFRRGEYNDSVCDLLTSVNSFWHDWGSIP